MPFAPLYNRKVIDDVVDEILEARMFVRPKSPWSFLVL